MTRIVLIQGHPTADDRHFCRALAEAYRNGAEDGGHEVRDFDVAKLQFTVLRSRKEWEGEPPAQDIADAQAIVAWAEHLVFVYPLWLGTMPALLKAFLEQTFRPGFAMGKEDEGNGWSKRLAGKSARIVVTMGMPALIYRWYFRAHGLKSFEQSILSIVSPSPEPPHSHRQRRGDRHGKAREVAGDHPRPRTGCSLIPARS